jgi:uncharacterized membrane protein
MRKQTVGSRLIAVAVAFSLYASAALANGSVGELVGSLAWSKRLPGVGANVVGSDKSAFAFIIPAAGSLAGANGTFFRSDVTLANRRNIPQTVAVGFLKRSVNNCAAATKLITIPANTTFMYRDFIGTTLLDSGIGSLLVVAVNSAGSVADNAGLIDGFSRIWTPQPGSSGTVSQSFEAISIDESALNRWAYGVRQDDAFRTNVGMVNLNNSVEITINGSITGLLGEATFSQKVKPCSMEQFGAPAGTYSDAFLFFSGPTDVIWSAYGTSVDNVTGDGWVTHAH